METQRLEVALIARTPGGGTQVLGRLDDPGLIAEVRERLVEKISDDGERQPLTLIRGGEHLAKKEVEQ